MEEKAILYLYNNDGDYGTQMEVLSLSEALEKARKYEKVSSVELAKGVRKHGYIKKRKI